MRSTFMGLEASKRGLFTQQSALYTTGHNISNANTEGYSRQRVNMQATTGYPMAGLNSPTYPGHLGTGVEASSVQRIRDEFIDRQYRQETNKLGYWESTITSINQMEDILAEPSEFGINQSFNDFWKSLQDLAANPENSASRKVVLAKAEALAESFNYNSKQLEMIQGNLGNEIAVSTKEINSIIKQIAAINGQIQTLEPNGYVTNDLYDARDVLVDQLNDYLPVTISQEPSGGNASKVAEGSMTIRFNGVLLVSGHEYAEIKTVSNGSQADPALKIPEAVGSDNIYERNEYGERIPVRGQDGKVVRDVNNQIEYEMKESAQVYDWEDTSWDTIDGNDLNEAFTGIAISEIGSPPDADLVQVENLIKYEELEQSKGKLVALIDAYGYKSPASTATKGNYPEMLQQLDKLVHSFKEAFNTVHQAGYSLDGTVITGEDFFIVNGAGELAVNEFFLENPSAIAASSGANEEGNGKWATELANMQFLGMAGNDGSTTNQTVTILGKTITFDAGIGLEGATFQDFYQGMIGDLAVKGREATRLEYNSATQRLTIENSRASMSSVSLDEEMTNMITFQQAYNANARMITVIDEILEKIINGMGRAGL